MEKIAILTSRNQWFIPFAKILNSKVQNSKIFFDHQEIVNNFDVLFILSYHKIIEESFLKQNKHNIVIHSSALPKGKGWAPMFWQILEGENQIPFTMFEASNGVDNGDIYMQKNLQLTGYELNEELREKQANFTIEMCLEFLENYDELQVPTPQTGEESFYQKRTSKDSELDIHKSIKEQFNLLRIVDNENYPAFFYRNGKKYILKIEEEK
jgi:methionyl-tRNA formyltransferase